VLDGKLITINCLLYLCLSC